MTPCSSDRHRAGSPGSCQPRRWQSRGRRGDIPSPGWHPLRQSSAASSGPFRLLTKSETCNQQERGRCCFHGSSGSSPHPQWREAPGCLLSGSSGARRRCPCGHTAPELPCSTKGMADSPAWAPPGPSGAPTALGEKELGGTRDLLLRQRCPLRRDVYKEPPDRAVPRSGSRAGGLGTSEMAQRVWGYRAQGRGWGGGKQPNTVWDGHMPVLPTWTELFRPATARSQLLHACLKHAAMNPEHAL